MHHTEDRAMTVEFASQNTEHVGLSLAAVNHHRKMVLTRQLQMTDKILLLYGKRRGVPVAIQSGFTDANNTLLFDKGTDRIPGSRASFRNVIGMNAGGSEQHRMALGQGDAGGTGRRAGSDSDDGLNTRRTGAVEDSRQIGSELLVVQVSVCIDETSHVNSHSLEVASQPSFPAVSDARA